MVQKDSEQQKIEALKTIVNWIKLNTILSHKQTILNILNTPKEKLVFQLSDGKTSRELAQQFHMDKNTITKWWRKWIDNGIAQPIVVKGGGIRAQRSFSLEDFGIEIPSMQEAMSQITPEEEE
jgi:hypothetical protein